MVITVAMSVQVVHMIVSVLVVLVVEEAARILVRIFASVVQVVVVDAQMVVLPAQDAQLLVDIFVKQHVGHVHHAPITVEALVVWGAGQAVVESVPMGA